MAETTDEALGLTSPVDKAKGDSKNAGGGGEVSPDGWKITKEAAAAHDDLRAMATDAASRIGGFTHADLSPSERGAKILFDQGFVDKDAFCEADAVTFETETLIEAEQAWSEGWDSVAPPDLKGPTGKGLYNALSIACLG